VLGYVMSLSTREICTMGVGEIRIRKCGEKECIRRGIRSTVEGDGAGLDGTVEQSICLDDRVSKVASVTSCANFTNLK
jgi:hypothetical protein